MCTVVNIPANGLMEDFSNNIGGKKKGGMQLWCHSGTSTGIEIFTERMWQRALPLGGTLHRNHVTLGRRRDHVTPWLSNLVSCQDSVAHVSDKLQEGSGLEQKQDKSM